jgi:cellulose synthase/poly-beta-1,6-N-acetylglucosamine synthase-like glycosyltransferase
MATVFFVSIWLLVYHFVLYPIILLVLTRIKPSCHSAINRLNVFPAMELIVPAHNEQDVIADKVKNILALDYPGDLAVTIALDGCSDGTEQILTTVMAEQKANHKQVSITVYRQNIGKVAVLNELIGRSTAEIIALSDTSSLLDADVLISAACYFADKRVGVVCGSYHLSAGSSFAERTYWRYQTYVKRLESAFGSVMGAHGAFYLFRRSLWTRLPSDTINDDFVLPMKIVATGAQAIYASEIGIEELEVSRSGQDIRRRIRLGAGNIQQLVMLAGLADPRRGRTAFMFMSGKALRSIAPYAFIAAFASGFIWIAVGNPMLATGIVVACGIVLLAPGSWGLLAMARYVALSTMASALGGLLYLFGPSGAAWKISRSGKQS